MKYPFEPPEVTYEAPDSAVLTAARLKQLKESTKAKIQECLGQEMVFDIVESAKEVISTFLETHLPSQTAVAEVL